MTVATTPRSVQPFHYLVVLVLIATSAGCERTAPDGLATRGTVKSVTGWPPAELKRGDLSDVQALKSLLNAIENDAPPIDHNDPKSRDRQHAYVERERVARIGKGDHLLVVKCGAEPGQEGHLAFSQSDKNLVVQLYTPSDAEALIGRVTTLLKKVEASFSADELYQISTGESRLEDFNVVEENPEIFRDVEKIGSEVSRLRLPSGDVLRVWNSPFDGRNFSLMGAVTSAQIEQNKVQWAILREQKPEFGTFRKPLAEERAKWRNFPRNFVHQTFWIAQKPFDGEPSSVCLVVRVSDLRLEAEERGLARNLQGSIQAWYLIDKNNLKIIAQAKAPDDT